MRAQIAVLLGLVLISCGGSDNITGTVDTPANEEVKVEVVESVEVQPITGLKFDNWHKWGFQSVSDRNIEVAACICYVVGPSLWDQRLADIQFLTIQRGSYPHDLGNVEAKLPASNCTTQVDIITNGPCSCPGDGTKGGGQLLGAHIFYGKQCPDPTPICVNPEVVYDHLYIGRSPTIVLSSVNVYGEGHFRFELRASKSDEAGIDNNYWLKDSSEFTLECGQYYQLNVRYEWQGHSAVYWAVILFKDDIEIRRQEFVKPNYTNPE